MCGEESWRSQTQQGKLYSDTHGENSIIQMWPCIIPLCSDKLAHSITWKTQSSVNYGHSCHPWAVEIYVYTWPMSHGCLTTSHTSHLSDLSCQLPHPTVAALWLHTLCHQVNKSYQCCSLREVNKQVSFNSDAQFWRGSTQKTSNSISCVKDSLLPHCLKCLLL